jgi:zinc protease
VSVGFGSDPTRTDSLIASVFQEIARLKADGPTPADLNDTREALLREFEAGSTQNGYLLTQIAGRYESGESVEALFGIGNTYRALTAADIQEAAKTYLSLTNYVKVTLFPEGPAGAPAAAAAADAAAK